ncbi:type IV toxin-antitoxin system AbiEi family antitoxin domain-containing protein [Janibacter sp. G368]|uniref:type IV toxin-antitoxin system AbiEi family antitoxin domain-containing protein n=1 Tax=Janibacter sp. G368 TaxID=3420441 RepID=UPI003D07F9B6
MSVIPLLVAQRGGSATRAEILEATTPWALQRALEEGVVVRHRRGVYGLPLDGDHHRAAELGVHLSHRSAALHHGLGVLHAPTRPEMVTRRDRGISTPEDVALRFRPLTPDDLGVRVTTPLRTVVDCARDLDLPEALAVADSALRSRLVSPRQLKDADLPRTGRAAARRVLDLASAKAVNPFESGLRGLAVQADDRGWVPQVPITLRDGRTLHADVGDPVTRVALEADNHEFHKKREDVRRDCWRYDEMILAGWVVLRFAWEHVMFKPDWVREVIAWVVRQRMSSCSSLIA